MESMNNITRTRNNGDAEEEEIANQMTGFMSRLPLDITFNILSKLPIKSLSQCRWVCKPWYKIITASHRFAKFQLAWATQNCSPWISYLESSVQKFYPIDPQTFDDHQTSITLTSPKFPSQGMLEVVGSCNGLICMGPDRGYNSDPYHVLNPITGEHITLPTPPTPLSTDDDETPQVFGFGVDPFTNNHKVIQIMLTRKVEIFTLGSDKWRMGSTDIPDIYLKFNMHTLFVNGALHLIVYVKERFVIASFDMATEKFREIVLPLCFNPDKVRDKWFCQLDLGVLEGCLCFIDANFEYYTEIWVMKSYGVQESWSKEYVVRKSLFSGYGQYQMTADEVIKLKNGELVLAKSMHYCDPQSNVYTSFVTHGMRWCRANDEGLQAITHAGTLISPQNIGRSTQSGHSANKNRSRISWRNGASNTRWAVFVLSFGR